MPTKKCWKVKYSFWKQVAVNVVVKKAEIGEAVTIADDYKEAVKKVTDFMLINGIKEISVLEVVFVGELI